MTRTYTIDLATGESTPTGPAPAIGAATDDAYFSCAEAFIDPDALAKPEVRRALGDIYQAIRSRRFVRNADQQTADESAVK
jgi:hypothetical protein